MKIILTALVSGVFSICQAQQDTGYAHEVLYELSSKKYHGRGYYGNGEIKAAKYICSQMEEIGLGKVGGKQYQSFPITGSIITKSTLKINDISLELGKQFLPGSANPTSSTKIWTTENVSYTILHIDSNTTKESLVKFFEKDITGALLIDTFGVKSKVNMRSIWSFIEKKELKRCSKCLRMILTMMWPGVHRILVYL